ncbi:MAG: type VI secretion system-associated protein TagF [Acetobacteraceae bacterium]
MTPCGFPCGFYGKIPARGDFVRSGLNSSFISAWDDWAQAVLVGSRSTMGEAWLGAWLEAPVWRFALPGGMFGPETVAGLFMPSVDRAGRYFPLCFACLGPGEAASVLADCAAGWLARAEAAGRAALTEDLAPEAVADRLARPQDGPVIGKALPPPLVPGDGGLWWTDGSPRVPSGALILPALPDAEKFAGMLDARFRPGGCGRAVAE